ncbi:hypothetical protein [Kribbella speibonae]|uniref:SRPBCC family protein n=1 Tax=Kribbella speibonae TaxID=1572660 RepID=A0A4R0IFY2_9ACTN|nr:hypothetical protein [Kribbella speibonae]TCC24636.1 hypothetical protein E0H58_10415 [Kribbella speibonae]TCC30950.1 hypothetical protein E0H92_38305 [Kribbella speibonae]
MSVLRDAETFAQWMVAVPPELRAGLNWPQVGSVILRDDGREPRARHAHNRQLLVAVVERWRPDSELVVRLRSGLGGWVEVAVKVQARPGGSLIEVRSEPLTATARLRYTGTARGRAEERCAQVAENLIALATVDEPED